MKSAWLGVLLGAWCVGVPACADQWVPAPGESRLSFTAEQQGAAFEGEFGNFEANFDLDPADPTTGRITATIDMDSVNTLYDERDEYLRGEEWFHVERWPTARFVTERIRATDNGYMADALLTMRDQTLPVAMAFRLETLPDGRLRFSGETPLKRLDFGVGQGQWTNTEWVGNDVTVTVDLVLETALP